MKRLLILVFCVSCTSYSSRQSATLIKKGESQKGIALDALVFERGRDYFIVPNPEFYYRRGLSSGANAALRINLTGFEVSTLHRLKQSPSLALAWGPMLGGGFQPVTNNTTDLFYARAGTRLVSDQRLNDDLTLVGAVAIYAEVAGPLTTFQGRIGDPSLRLGTALTLGLRTLCKGRALQLEATVVPSYERKNSFERPAFQLGLGINL